MPGAGVLAGTTISLPLFRINLGATQLIGGRTKQEELSGGRPSIGFISHSASVPGAGVLAGTTISSPLFWINLGATQFIGGRTKLEEMSGGQPSIGFVSHSASVLEAGVVSLVLGGGVLDAVLETGTGLWHDDVARVVVLLAPETDVLLFFSLLGTKGCPVLLKVGDWLVLGATSDSLGIPRDAPLLIVSCDESSLLLACVAVHNSAGEVGMIG